MGIKWCPKCGRINSVTGWTPRYCMWGCGSLEDMPELPPVEKWDCDYYEMVERCREEYSKTHFLRTEGKASGKTTLMKRKPETYTQMKLF